MTAKKNNQIVEATPTIEATAITVATPTYVIADLYKEHKTTSAVIRYLFANGMAKADIARFLNKRYQHIRNVLLQPLKVSEVESTTETTEAPVEGSESEIG